MMTASARLHLSLVVLSLVVTGCVVDEDGDGFSDKEDCDDGDADIHPEAQEACDGIDNDCSDGVDDGLSTRSWPDNGWSKTLPCSVPEDLVGSGYRTGDVAHDFTLGDQDGNDVQLYQFYGKVVVVDVYAQWCGPCQENAPHGQDLWEEGDGEVILLAATQQDYETNPPDGEDLNAWVDAYSLTHPVLADPEMTQGEFVVTGYPTYVVIDQEMNIVNDDLWPFDGDEVLALLD